MGVEPTCQVWKTRTCAARPRAHSAEGEGVEPSRLALNRFRDGRHRQLACPSVWSLDGWIRTSVVRLPRPADETRLSYIQIVNPDYSPRNTRRHPNGHRCTQMNTNGKIDGTVFIRVDLCSSVADLDFFRVVRVFRGSINASVKWDPPDLNRHRQS